MIGLLVTVALLIVASILVWALFDDAGLTAIACVWMIFILYVGFGYHAQIVTTIQNVMRG